MSLPIAQLGQPVLREKAKDVPADEIRTPEFQSFLQSMTDTLIASGGVGLAAPQIFDSRRVFLARVIPPVTDDEDELPGIETLVNPRIVGVSEETSLGWEGCLSFMELTVLVPRHRRIVVEFLDATGLPRTLDLTDFPARIIQHEYDHLEGILTIDRARSTLDIVKSSEMETVIESRKPRTESAAE